MWPIAKSMRQIQQITGSLFGVKPSDVLIVLDFDKTLISAMQVSAGDGSPTPIIKGRLCDSETPAVLTELRKGGSDIIILTARNRSDVGFTEETVRTLLPKNVLLVQSPHETPNWYFANGICSCAASPKGDVLVELLTHLRRKYQCIIVIDDRADNLHSYIKRLADTNNRFVPILYQFTPSEVSSGQYLSVKLRANKHIRVHTHGGSSIEINEPLTD